MLIGRHSDIFFIYIDFFINDISDIFNVYLSFFLLIS